MGRIATRPDVLADGRRPTTVTPTGVPTSPRARRSGIGPVLICLVQIAYAPTAEAADRALAARVAMMQTPGVTAHIRGTGNGLVGGAS